MPRLSAFHGIVICLYIRDHGVPHIHGSHGDDVAVIEVGTGTVLAGRLKPRQAALVGEWVDLHRFELLVAWVRASAGELPGYDRATAMTSSASIPSVVGVAVVRPHLMRLLFDDGVVRDIEYVPGEARASLVKALDDPVYFAQVRVDPDAHTVVWPNGLDLAPEVLHGDYEADDEFGFHDVTAVSQKA
ncbi:MAG: DUF4160 domain-containing protein [Acidimicrobiales bacterium]